AAEDRRQTHDGQRPERGGERQEPAPHERAERDGRSSEEAQQKPYQEAEQHLSHEGQVGVGDEDRPGAHQRLTYAGDRREDARRDPEPHDESLPRQEENERDGGY